MLSSLKNPVEITQNFINTMFQHSLFQQKFYDLMQSANGINTNSFFISKNGQTSQIVQQITQTLFQNLIQTQEQIRGRFKQQLTAIHLQMQKLKDLSYQNIARIDELPKEQGYQSILQDDQIFDMPSMKRTISFLKEKVKEISQNSTVMLESSQISKQYKDKDQVLNDKISAEITKIEQKLASQYEVLQETVNKKIEKQQRTINNILETLNQITGHDKKDKTAATLTNCKSATKLKSFFGFG